MRVSEFLTVAWRLIEALLDSENFLFDIKELCVFSRAGMDPA